MSDRKISAFLLPTLIVIGIIAAGPASAAVVIAEQTDGSLTGSAGTGCNNACSDIAVGSQIFTAATSGKLGALEIFTSSFSSMSRDPSGNDCYLTLYDQNNGTLLASSDNRFNGYGCAGDLVFAFKNSQPFLRAGGRYRWNYVFGGQNFSAITFIGGSVDMVDGSFNVAPLGGAKFNAFATIMPPQSLGQLMGNGATTPLKHGDTSDGPVVTLAATLPAPLPDALQLQVELEPSFIPFKNESNLTSSFLPSDSTAQTITPNLLNGAYHWQARAADADGNTSPWQPMNATPEDPDFYIHDPAGGIMVQDNITSYHRQAWPDPCLDDGTAIPCPLYPSFVNYRIATPFAISKITFNWSNNGGNNCDNIGHYGAVITDANAADQKFIGKSTNTVYLGCAPPGGSRGTAELDFKSAVVPPSFFFTLSSFDGSLQGGSDIFVSDVIIFGTPISSSTQRKPVVIVPGIMGSRLNEVGSGHEAWPDANAMIFSNSDSYLDDLKLSRSGEQISGMKMVASDIIRTVTTSIPFANQNVYKPLLDSLIAGGYQEGVDLFVAPYDWRIDIASSARSLDPFLRNAIARSPDGKIDIVAHSMGGLVIKEYLSRLSTASTTASIDKLILAGTPQLGAPQIFKTLQYGDDLGFHVGPIELLAPSEVKSITQNMPAAYELLPSRRYTEIQGGYVIDNRKDRHTSLDFDHTNEFLMSDSADARNPILLAGADTFHARQDHLAASTPSVYNIVGCQNPSTAISYILEDDGEADIIRGAGDGTVPVISAMNLADGYQNYFSLYSENGADHSGLFGNSRPLALINAILGNATSSLALAPLGISTSTQDCFQGRSSFHNATTIEVSTHSPVTLNAYDSQNRHTGPAASTNGTIDLQIPGSSYETIGENSFLLLPASDTYRIMNNARATGTFTMKIKTLDDAANLFGLTTYINIPLASASTTATLTITGPASSSAIRLNTDGSEETLIAPTASLSGPSSTDITPPEITMPDIPAIIDYGTPVNFTFSVSDDLSGVAITIAEIDGTAIGNDKITSALSEGIHSLRIEAVDNAGNRRSKTITFGIIATTGGSGGVSTPKNNAVVEVPAPSPGGSGATQNRCKKKSTLQQ